MFAITTAGATAQAPLDVLLTPPAMAPVPYPNTAQNAVATATAANMLIAGTPPHNLGTIIPMSDGANAGVAGVASGTVRGSSRPMTGAFTVLWRGQPAVRLSSQTMQNTMNAPGMHGAPSQTKVLLLSP